MTVSRSRKVQSQKERDMIVDDLANLSQYRELYPAIGPALDFLSRQDLAQLELGRHEIDGDSMYAMLMEYDTVTEQKAMWESHQRYVDIHRVVSGSERISYAWIRALKQTAPYDFADDYVAFEGTGDLIPVTGSRFVIFFPQDAHRPAIHAAEASGRVRKIVLKIDVQKMTVPHLAYGSGQIHDLAGES